MVNLKGDPMKNGSVQRASKRSYMDEATLASVLKAVEELRSEITRVERAASAGCTELVEAITEAKGELDAKVGGIELQVADLRERVVAITNHVVANEIEAASEPTCDHGFIGACSECDGAGQTPENDAA